MIRGIYHYAPRPMYCSQFHLPGIAKILAAEVQWCPAKGIIENAGA
ncbi:MAG: hypothetical protein MR966_04440 [Lachnospiraceae bacterium]|nr:hypothetical protein [Lachnospiraceae bacterium]